MSKIETKVTVASLGSLAAGVALAVITAFLAEPGAFGPLPEPVVFLLVAALPPVAAFLAGYTAPHTDRPAPGDGA
ncbi:hypothetical protein [Nocardiopsis eucommiae]|uniref:hypothetical protein n=1 Tax=Nocardiopsis eucommiae TaxID=2831970 RepID=UPI003D710BCB